MASYESGYDEQLGYNRNAFVHGTPVTNLLGKIDRAIAAPIGLVSEAVHKKKDGKQAVSQPNTAADTGLVSEDREVLEEKDEDFAAEVDLDEIDWALDDATAVIEEENKTSLLDRIAKLPQATNSQIPFPVILPQRRPGTKNRGFVRAYAPVLQDCGIDENLFLNFLKELHIHAQASPVFKVIKLASNIAGVYPDPMVTIASLAARVLAGIGEEIHERYRTNTFMDEINEKLFKPRGLYAFIVTYKRGEAGTPAVETATVDIGASALAKYGSINNQDGVEPESRLDEIKSKLKRLRLASGATHESEMPVMSAELLFPGLDAVQDTYNEKDAVTKNDTINSLKARSRSTSKFVNDYFDRRAQAVFAFDNPDAVLTKQVAAKSPHFRSRYADPNNHTNKHFFTLITGGHFKAEPLGARRRWEKAQRKAAERRAQGMKLTPKKRFLEEDVLYLTVVNMPSNAELEQARRELEQDRRNGQP